MRYEGIVYRPPSEASYATRRSPLLKSQEDLELLHFSGLEMLYLGLESGCDTVLSYMRKRVTAAEITKAEQKAKQAMIHIRDKFQ